MELKHYRGKLRRFYISHLQEDYLENQLEKRRGECNQCGRCCSLGYRCMFLTKDNLCSIYNQHSWMRPKQCESFPIDQRDLEELSCSRCGYYFEGQ